MVVVVGWMACGANFMVTEPEHEQLSTWIEREREEMMDSSLLIL